jgi:hypothetical protein
VRESHRVHVNAGHGSAIFVFAGRWSAPGGAGAGEASQFSASGSALPGAESAVSPATRHPAFGLSLRTVEGEPVANLKARSAAELGSGRDPWAACNVQVDPGVYRLRLQLPTRDSLEQVIVAAPGWQTEIFLQPRLYRSPSGETESERADLAGASILYSRFNPDDPAGSLAFAPDDPDFGPSLRLLELARLGLISGRNVLSRDITEMLWAKWQNPMLGIVGAHLLLLSPEPDRELLGIVVNNLRYGIWPGFRHPDVEALALRLEAAASDYAFATPPMLRSSWSLVIDASIAAASLVPEGSLAFDVATRVWGNSPWLLWRNPPPGRRPATPVDEYADALSAQMAAIEEPASKGGTRRLAGAPDPSGDIRRLSKGLNLPRSNVEALYRKTRKE